MDQTLVPFILTGGSFIPIIILYSISTTTIHWALTDKSKQPQFFVNYVNLSPNGKYLAVRILEVPGNIGFITIIDTANGAVLSSKQYGLIMDHIPSTVKQMLLNSMGTAIYVQDIVYPVASNQHILFRFDPLSTTQTSANWGLRIPFDKNPFGVTFGTSENVILSFDLIQGEASVSLIDDTN